MIGVHFPFVVSLFLTFKWTVKLAMQQTQSTDMSECLFLLKYYDEEEMGFSNKRIGDSCNAGKSKNSLQRL